MKKIKVSEEYKKLVPRHIPYDYLRLENSIKKYGVRDSIIVNPQGIILDGYTRYEIALKYNKKINTIERSFSNKFEEKKFVIEANLERRHLNQYQRGKLGLNLLKIEEEAAKERQATSGKGMYGGKPLKENLPEAVSGQARDIVAEAVGISGKQLDRVNVIEKKATDEQKIDLDEGEASINAIYLDIIISEKKEKRLKEINEKSKKYKPDALIKIIHGDVLIKLELIQDASIDLLLTDPPYGVMKDYDWDSVDSEFLNNWIAKVKPKLKSDFLGFIFCDSRKQFSFEKVIQKYFNINNRIIWVRRNMSLGRIVQNKFISAYETIFFFGNKNLNLPQEWGTERFDVKEYAVPQTNFIEGKDHPTQKPLELIKELVQLGSTEEEIVLDCFAGSGTTALACKQLKRNCIVIEKEKKYIDIIKAKLNEF